MLQVECLAETKLMKTSKCLEPRESRQGGEGEATLLDRHGLGRVPWMEGGNSRSLASPHCREPEAQPGSWWVPIWRAKTAGWVD